MAIYHYLACSPEGQLREGDLEASSAREAAHVVRGQMLKVLSLRKAEEKRRPFFQRSPVTRSHAAFFCRQLAVMADSQPIHEILASLSKEGGDSAYQRMLLDLKESVELGHSLADALKKYESAFSASAIHLIEAGEASGNLPEILARLADYLEKEEETRQKLHSLMFYPMLLALAAMASLFVMMVFILPSFVDLLEGLHVALPLPTRLLISLGKFLGEYGYILPPAFLVLAYGCRKLYEREDLRLSVDTLILKVPIFGTLKSQIEWMRVLGSLSVLLGGGVRMDEALSMAGNVTENRCLRFFLRNAKKSVQQGYSLTAALQGFAGFPAMLLQLTASGEQSGRLEEMLQKAADYCRISSENKSRRLQAMMEPALILLMGSVVIFFLLAVVLPLLDSMEAISA